MQNLLFDLRVALSSLRKSPTFAGIAIGVFALGIGAAVAVFGIVQSVVFRPLGYPDEARLVGVTSLHQTESLEERGVFFPTSGSGGGSAGRSTLSPSTAGAR
jgi:putative ABC transport system permease protein